PAPIAGRRPSRPRTLRRRSVLSGRNIQALPSPTPGLFWSSSFTLLLFPVGLCWYYHNSMVPVRCQCFAASRDRGACPRFRPVTGGPSSGGHRTVQNVLITQPSKVRVQIPFRGQVILAVAGVPHNVDGFPCTPRPLIGTLD